MKKFLPVFLLFCLTSFISKAQFVSIPDDDFKTFLLSKYPACFNGSGQLDTTCTAITTEDSLIFSSSLSNQNNYVAIAYFDALDYLDLSNNNIGFATQLPAHFPATLSTFIANHIFHGTGSGEIFSPLLPAAVRHVDYSYSKWPDLTGTIWPASLKYLNLSNNGIASDCGLLPAGLDTLILSSQREDAGFASSLSALPSLPANLKYLDCSENTIAGFASLPATLTYFDCSHQFFVQGLSFSVPVPLLGNLPALPSNLVTLKCYANRLTTLPTLPATLQYLNCAGQRFSITLEGILWDYPGISQLPVLPDGLKYFNCATNALLTSTLPATLPPALEFLNVGYNNITVLPSLPNTLTGLGLSATLINSLPNPLPPSLNYLYCNNNAGISCLPHLPATMGDLSIYSSSYYNLDVTATGINCIPNYVPGIRIKAASTLPLCNMTNNSNGCEINPIIAGKIFYDNNSNGVQDPGELPRANVRVNLNSADYSFSDLNGLYEMTATIGNNILTIDPPPYYIPVPSSINHTVNLPNTIFNDVVALQPVSIFDSVKITITPSTNPRINAAFSYYIQYENVGTTVANPSLAVSYDISNLVYNNSTNPSVMQAGNMLNLLPGTLQPGQGGAFTLSFTVSTAATIGTMISGLATASAGSNTCTDSTSNVIIGPIDPNDKQSTPSLTPEQVASGTFINYLIRFQNVGTASALNVFITDTLSSLLQENSLEMIASSHPCSVTLSGNRLLIEFRNINLPDQNSNEAGSHGFVRFRIKPQTSLLLNTEVLNKASIYFDYNLPVETGNAVTLVSLSPVPLSLLDFKGTIQPGNRALLQWKTANEFNVSRFEIEQAVNGDKFSVVATEEAAGSGDHTYSRSLSLPAGIVYYRLKITDNDGKYKYSNTVRLSDAKTTAGIAILNNPVRNELNIRITDNSLINTKAFIINSQGSKLRSWLLEGGSRQLDVSDLAAGIYFIRTASGCERILISR